MKKFIIIYKLHDHIGKKYTIIEASAFSQQMEWKRHIHHKLHEILRTELTGYRLDKISEKTVIDKHNVNNKLLLWKYFDSCTKKFSKGIKPKNKLEILNYRFSLHQFELNDPSLIGGQKQCQSDRVLDKELAYCLPKPPQISMEDEEPECPPGQVWSSDLGDCFDPASSVFPISIPEGG